MGVLCSDQLDIAERAAREGICYSICNLDTTAQPGSHWVGLFATSDKGLLVYDSFGRCHRKILPFGSAMVLENTDMDKEQRDSERELWGKNARLAYGVSMRWSRSREDDMI